MNNAQKPKFHIGAIVPFIARMGVAGLIIGGIVLAMQIFMGAPMRPMNWFAHQDATMDYIQARGELEIDILKRQIDAHRDYLENLNEGLSNMNRNIVAHDYDWRKNCDLLAIFDGGLCHEFRELRFGGVREEVDLQRAQVIAELEALETRYATLREGRPVFQFGEGPAQHTKPEFEF